MKNIHDQHSSATKHTELQELWVASLELCQSILLGLRPELQHRFGDDFPELQIVAFDPLSDNKHPNHKWAMTPRIYRVLEVVLVEYTVRKRETLTDYAKEETGEVDAEVFSVTRTLQFPTVFFHALAKRDTVAIDQFGEIVLSAFRCDIGISKLDYLFHTDVDHNSGIASLVDNENKEIVRKCKKQEITAAVKEIAGSGSRIVVFRGRPFNSRSFLLDVIFAVSKDASIRDMPSPKKITFFKTDFTGSGPNGPRRKSEDLFRITTMFRFDRVQSAESSLVSLFDLARDFAALLLGATADQSLVYWEPEFGTCCSGCHEAESDCWCRTFPGKAIALNFANPIVQGTSLKVVDLDEEIPF